MLRAASSPPHHHSTPPARAFLTACARLTRTKIVSWVSRILSPEATPPVWPRGNRSGGGFNRRTSRLLVLQGRPRPAPSQLTDPTTSNSLSASNLDKRSALAGWWAGLRRWEALRSSRTRRPTTRLFKTRRLPSPALPSREFLHFDLAGCTTGNRLPDTSFVEMRGQLLSPRCLAQLLLSGIDSTNRSLTSPLTGSVQ